MLSLLIAVVSGFAVATAATGQREGSRRRLQGWGSMKHWTDFGLRQMPSLSARRAAQFPAAMQALVDERAEQLREPFRGLTTEGIIRPGLFPLRATGVSTAPIAEAAVAFVGCAQRRAAPAGRAPARFGRAPEVAECPPLRVPSRHDARGAGTGHAPAWPRPAAGQLVGQGLCPGPRHHAAERAARRGDGHARRLR